MDEKNKINWSDVIAKSNGNVILLPEEFTKEADEIEKDRKKLTELLLVAAKLEVSMKTKVQVTFFEIRKALEKVYGQEIWNKDVGFNDDALKEGKYILNVTTPPGR